MGVSVAHPQSGYSSAVSGSNWNLELRSTRRKTSRSRGSFLESPGNLPGPLSVFGDKCFLTEVNFC